MTDLIFVKGEDAVKDCAECKAKQDRIDELEGALKPFIENYEKYGNHGPFAHGLFIRAKKALGGGE